MDQKGFQKQPERADFVSPQQSSVEAFLKVVGRTIPPFLGFFEGQ